MNRDYRLRDRSFQDSCPYLIGCFSIGNWNDKTKCTSLAFTFTLHPDSPAMEFHKPFGQGQTQSCPLLVPIQSVHTDGPERWVFLMDPQTNELVKTPVKTGMTTFDSVEIINGLKAGDQIAM